MQIFIILNKNYREKNGLKWGKQWIYRHMQRVV